ncbi:hypothetical protein J4734_27225 [Klebsiella pneumoniae]|uniref:Uncharacterized protein n=1 Tax=Klebsiella pneumoniae TaxID=573 RepID=A0A939SQH8_KLEPN|nr:hypothetical protein [Klebsiella pneumoniae]
MDSRLCRSGAWGYISDKIFKLTGRLLLSRKIVLVVCLLMAAICVGLAGTVSSVVPAVLLMSVSIFFLYVTGAIYWAIIQTWCINPRRRRQRLYPSYRQRLRHRGAGCYRLYRAVYW